MQIIMNKNILDGCLNFLSIYIEMFFSPYGELKWINKAKKNLPSKRSLYNDLIGNLTTKCLNLDQKDFRLCSVLFFRYNIKSMPFHLPFLAYVLIYYLYVYMCYVCMHDCKHVCMYVSTHAQEHPAEEDTGCPVLPFVTLFPWSVTEPGLAVCK